LQTVIGWEALWLVAAGLGVAFAAAAWGLEPSDPAPRLSEPAAEGAGAVRVERPSASMRNAGLLVAAYFLEGVGYIILGTFLVAAVSADGPAWTGPGSWVLVGLAAAPSTALWSVARRRFS